jgi:hypothetical protein
LYDALAANPLAPAKREPAFQAVFCIDEREESFRRHLEEAAPEAETLGAAGFFGVAMYYRGVGDAHARPLCPPSMRPRHYVAEAHRDEQGMLARWQRLQRRGTGLIDETLHHGSRTLVRGSVVMALLGALAVIPLVLRVVFPWLGRYLMRYAPAVTPPARTRLLLDRTGSQLRSGVDSGFTVDEMVEIVRTELENLGLSQRLAPFVVVVGHGSTSLNNPHESAHDCGACGGGHGGPNARAFAAMANDRRVRARLREQGSSIPAATWFLGGERNTANNAVAFFDVDRVPEAARPAFERAREAFEAAREREAHERCRRLDGFPNWFPPSAALLHVEARAADLAQPRPEYGHATNAACVVARRDRTRSLFLDRRVFLVSYDPTLDAEGRILGRLLSAVVPVVAGINLEYYFGYVDPTGYGCGTKLPHNVTSLLGVMDGAESDLRTGLPWQMLEIHEPVRLTVVIECTEPVLRHVLSADPSLSRLVENRWLYLARLDPGSNDVWEVGPERAARYVPERAPAAAATSIAVYRGKREHLPFARLTGHDEARS